MQFEISHEFDAPLDVVELALLSPELGSMLAKTLPNIESVETVSHEVRDGELRRTLRFQAIAPLPIFRGYNVTRDAMTWEERTTYSLSEHASRWSVTPKESFRRYVRSEGTYTLERAPDGRTRRTVRGELEVRVAVLGKLIERMALAEVKRTYDAEAESLRQLATL